MNILRKTPGVYIEEKKAFPNSVVEVPTAIPAFIGFTEKTPDGINKPWKISSMAEFIKYFGEEADLKFKFNIVKYDPVKKTNVSENKTKTSNNPIPKPEPGIFQSTVEIVEDGVTNGYAFRIEGKYNMLFEHLKLFFANGGGVCYIVSIGLCSDNKKITKELVEAALIPLTKEQEVTMIVVPEAVYGKVVVDDKTGSTTSNVCKDIQESILKHCGEMKNRFAILDIQPKQTVDKQEDTIKRQIERFRELDSQYLSYGAAYYPWLEIPIKSKGKSYEMLIWTKGICFLLGKFFNNESDKTLLESIKNALKESDSNDVNNDDKIDNVLKEWLIYQKAIKALNDYLSIKDTLSPSAAIAGIYASVDNTRGVWKVPANVSVSGINKLSEAINDQAQKDMNMPDNGKAVNAIRAFTGYGIKVWGARTLKGNDKDWCYINVRRTMIFLEESIKSATRAYIFEPNDANTWLNVRCMIENFLHSVWKRGGLAGATPEEAYSVHIGLGETMTAQDILEGKMLITVLVAISHPAEFIEITFQQQMQKS